MASEEIDIPITWSDRLEEYFASTGERSNCLSWLHYHSELYYAKRRTFIDLPVIIFSGVIAFLNAASSSLFENDTKMASIALGIGSLVVSILNTIGSYFSWAKRAENHRLSSIAYAKLFRFISVEMNLPRNERIRPNDLLKMVKDRYDQLQETSPAIPLTVVNDFKSRFSVQKYEKISRPIECNGLEEIKIYNQNGTISGTISPIPNTPKAKLEIRETQRTQETVG